MKNYDRHYGDDLLSKDSRLKYNWRWIRAASMIEPEDIKKWTHFQSSYCRIFDWVLEAIQWPEGRGAVSYEAEVKFVNNHIISKKGFETRLDAQIGAEKLLHKWIKSEAKKLRGF